MNSSGVQKAGTILSVVDLALIGALFLYTKRRLDSLEKGGSSSISSGSSTLRETSQNRILRLENDNEIQRQVIKVHEDLMTRMMIEIRDLKLLTENMGGSTHHIETSPAPRKTIMRSRPDDSLFTRKEHFVEADASSDEDPSNHGVDDDEMFSFLKG